MNVTNASATEIYRFMREALKDEGNEDRSGRTPLQAFADELSTLEFDAPGLQNYFNVAARLINEAPALSEVELSRLTALIRTAPMAPDVTRNSRRLLASADSKLSPSKRADLVRLLSRSGHRFRPKEIERFDIQSVRPWLWFDVMMRSKPAVAIDALPKLRNLDGYFPAILSRVNSLYHFLPRPVFEIFLTVFFETLSEADQQKLSRYSNQFGIDLFDADSNEPPQDIGAFTNQTIREIPDANILELAPT